MSCSEFHPVARSAQPALELISLARLSADTARQNLRALLLENPNYFGRITGNSFRAVLRIQEDTSYECLSYAGYNPRRELLQAVIRVKQSRGYSAVNRQRGSTEFVRFYLSFDDGGSWRDQGLHSVVVSDTGPRDQLVMAGIGPARTFCFMRTPPRMRAILSWNAAPPANVPDWMPVWGNVWESQIDPDESRDSLLDPVDRTLVTMPGAGLVA